MLITKAPSFRRGTNSDPSLRPSTVVPAVRAATRPSVASGCRNPQRRSGWNSERANRSTSVSRSDIVRGRPTEASTGMRVSDSTSDAARAKMTVSAIGRNSFPSIPSKVNMGKYTIMMISSPNMVGFLTSTAASRMMASFVRWERSWARRRTQFSTITTELSTTSPKSMAPRLIRLPSMPTRSITVTANSMDSGMAEATMSPARRLPRKAKRTATTRIAPSRRFRSTVLSTASTRSDRL